jgi:hypothetical protein
LAIAAPRCGPVYVTCDVPGNSRSTAMTMASCMACSMSLIGVTVIPHFIRWHVEDRSVRISVTCLAPTVIVELTLTGAVFTARALTAWTRHPFSHHRHPLPSARRTSSSPA